MKKVFFFLLLLIATLRAQTTLTILDSLIEKGNFNIAMKLINDSKSTEDYLLKYELEFRKDLMNRILLDFNKSETDVRNYIKKYLPEFSDEDFDKWKKFKQIESMNIDGIDRYFHSAARNFFRLNKEAKQIFIEINNFKKEGLNIFLENYIPDVMSELKKSKQNLTAAKKTKLHYTITVPANTIPENEIIRCWLPYPKEIPNRQFNVNLTYINSDKYLISSNESPHRTLYLEKLTKQNEETVFEMKIEYMSSDYKVVLSEQKEYNVNYNNDYLKKFLIEEYPHIVFTEELKELSKKIVGNEKNKLKKAMLIYQWINDSIPWASAREYSTIKNISQYCIANRHGDCGIQSLLFITLCRLNGIPAKWQSGWMLHPNEVNLHDWAEIYFDETGWMPVDQSFGLQDLSNDEQKWFFFGGLDRFHLIINDDIGQKFFPSKIYPRSETVDFQRGELEWKGGNLYFDKWDYEMKVEYE